VQPTDKKKTTNKEKQRWYSRMKDEKLVYFQSLFRLHIRTIYAVKTI